AFVLERGGKRSRRNLLPRCAAIFCCEQGELAVNGIAQHNAVLAVPEGNSVKENPSALFLKDPLPSLAAVERAIDLRLAFLRRPGADDDRGVLIESADTAEVEAICAGHAQHRPVLTTVHRPDYSAAGPAGPDHFLIDHAQSTQARRCGDGDFGPLGRGDGGKQQQQRKKEFHRKLDSSVTASIMSA